MAIICRVGRQTFYFLTLFLAVVAGVRAQGLAAVVELSTDKADIGEDLHVKCTVTNKGPHGFYVRWLRKVGDKQVSIGVNTLIEEPFKQTGRYKASYQADETQTSQTFIFWLNITNVQASDSGEIGCELPENDLVVLENFVVKDTPKFQCDKQMAAVLHQLDFNITCVIVAEPPMLEGRIFWTHDDGVNNVSLENGQMSGHYYAAIVPGETERETIMVLNIDRVYTQDFRTYYFEATNDLGSEVHEIELIRADEMP